MKSNKILVIVVALAMSLTATAQVRSSYFLRGSTERYELNPSLSPERGYFAIPALGLTTALESNFLSADNFFFPNGDGTGVVTYMHSSVSADDFLDRLSDMNRLEMNIHDRLLAMGNYFRGGFWSVDVSLRSESSINIPKDFFALTKTLATGTYDMAGLGIETNNFVEAAMGYTFPVQDVFTIGVRAKALVGLAHMKARFDKVDISIGTEEYTANMAGTIEANVAGYNFDGLTGEVTFDQMLGYATDLNNFSPDNIRSVGFAFDAGIEWTFMDEQLRLSAAITDFGYTSWTPQNSFCGTVENVGFAFRGYDVANNEIDFSTPEQIVMTAADAESAGKSTLHTNYVVGCEYNFLGDLIGLGVLWQGKQYGEVLHNTASVAATFRPTPWLSATISESFLDNQVGVLGAAVNIHSSLVNIFFGVDYIGTSFGTALGGKLPVPLSQNSANITFGLSLPLGIRMF